MLDVDKISADSRPYDGRILKQRKYEDSRLKYYFRSTDELVLRRSALQNINC